MSGMFLFVYLVYGAVVVGPSTGDCCVGVSVAAAGRANVFVAGALVGGSLVGGAVVGVRVGGNCVTVGVIVGSGVGVGTLSVMVTRRSA